MNGFQELNCSELYQINGGNDKDKGILYYVGYFFGFIDGWNEAAPKPAKPRPEPIHRGVGNGNP